MQAGNAAPSPIPSSGQEEEKHFAFGENWRNFLSVLNDDRIAEAEKSLREMLRVETLAGKRFLDIGAGSGLFSLAARRLGAQVYSFDYDADSVGCTQELRRRYFPADTAREWHIEQGSVLDKDYMGKLGQFDFVYSWGVLHHTGSMWQALENVTGNVGPRGTLFIAIYNDEGWRSSLNKKIKKTYNSATPFIRKLMAGAYLVHTSARGFIIDVLQRKNPLDRYRQKIESRGMSVWYDVVDWLGGWPFEVASPEALFEFYYQRGFDLTKLKTVPRGHGCNEFVFRRRG